MFVEKKSNGAHLLDLLTLWNVDENASCSIYIPEGCKHTILKMHLDLREVYARLVRYVLCVEQKY